VTLKKESQIESACKWKHVRIRNQVMNIMSPVEDNPHLVLDDLAQGE
jgi:hypothetical protein